ncbi:hypothetical protein FMUND_14356 [Fusarium mundagurra]|uniref:Uncharacterized protein n=1 Tax=Fusarium mundagurra TaxID=1567541 RepID=A0A8H5XVQ3_9HYPO|nr:hypothetical protein FMUND_14356 [Fusarium mundagurra]
MNPIDASRYFPDDSLPPEGKFSSRKKLVTAINAWAAPRGYAFSVKNSLKTSSRRIGAIYDAFSVIAKEAYLASLDVSKVWQLANADVAPKEIRSYLHMNSDTLATQQYIYNCIARGKRELARGQSNIRAPADELNGEGFWS